GAATRASVLRELVKLAGETWQVYDPEAVLEAISAREEMGSTALACGLAIPHAPRPLGDAILGEPVVAFGKTSRAVPFGGERGGGLRGGHRPGAAAGEVPHRRQG